MAFPHVILRLIVRAFALAILCVTELAAGPVRFDLPAQSAATALVAFARQAQVEVLFAFDELKAVRSNAVAGVFDPSVAIELLLRGTGFTATPNATGKFVVVRDAEPQAKSRPALP